MPVNSPPLSEINILMAGNPGANHVDKNLSATSWAVLFFKRAARQKEVA